MQESVSASFEQLLQKESVLIGKFLEHLNLAHEAIADASIKVFIKHLIDEELEHRQEVEELIAQVQGGPAISPRTNDQGPQPTAANINAGAPEMIVHDPTTGHYARRDLNVLSVGSLLGQRQ